MHPAIRILMDEHREIEKVLGALETWVSAATPGSGLDRAPAARFARFFRQFADAAHHGKEEDILFAALLERGFSAQNGPVAVMLYEHTLGREHVGALRAFGSGEGAPSAAESDGLVAHAASYVPLLSAHIQKEDNILYPMALRVLAEPELDALAARYEAFEKQAFADGSRDELLRLAGDLATAFPPDPARMAAAVGAGHCRG